MKKITIFIVFMALALSLALSATPVYAVPALPHAFYGSVEINGGSAPTGTRVEARGTGVMTGIENNPTITTVAGIYGTSNPFQPRLIVQGDIDDGATITFYVNGVSTGQTAEWHSGQTTDLPLSVTISAPPPPPPPTIEATLFGSVSTFSISGTGEVLETITAISGDGMLTITIPEGTIALDADGDPLPTLTVELDPTPPDPPEDAYIIGIPYNFGPDGATFDPPITFTWSYDPDALPEGVAEEDLVIAYYDEGAGEWVELPSVVDPITHTITALVAHFTTFAIIGAVTPPEEEVVVPEEEVVVPEEEVVEPEEEVVEPEEEVIVPEEEVVEPEEEAAVPSAPVAKPSNWPLISGIIAAVVVVGLLIFFLVRRRAY